jgi:Mrp family chromosome partitioning ATPase
MLQEMDKNGWQFLAVTSPTSGCGTSTIACNLALSIARLADRAVVLVDLDFRSPSVAKFFGVSCDTGVADILAGKALLAETMVNATVGPSSLLLLPGKGNVSHSSDLLASQSMANLLQTLKREFRNRTMIFDLPPVLTGDDVISVLPRMDAALLVASAGRSRIEDVHACKRYLEQTPVVRVVVNQVPPSKAQYTKY